MSNVAKIQTRLEEAKAVLRRLAKENGGTASAGGSAYHKAKQTISDCEARLREIRNQPPIPSNLPLPSSPPKPRA